MADATTPAPAPPPRWQAALERVAAALAVRAVKKWVIPAALWVASLFGMYFMAGGKEVVEVVREVPAPEQLAAAAPLIDYEGHRFDGGDHDHDHPQALVGGKAEAARWPTDRITYGIDYPTVRGINPPLSDDAVRAAFRQATGWWAEHLELDFVEVPYSAGPMIPIRFEPIDRPGGILAQAYLTDGTLRPKPLTMDVAEYWTAGAPAQGRVSIPTVACHELGHSLGKGHDAANAPAVMRPTYSASIPREQERDIQSMVALGYRRRQKVPPAPTDVLTFPVQVKTDDVIQSLRNAGYTVTK